MPNSVPNLEVFIVALPIGNVEDLSPRAKNALQTADVIFCEDTRKTLDLARRVGLDLSKSDLIALPGDQESQISFEKIFKKSLEEKSAAVWALVSDAGTPLVNDPGAHLVNWARGQGIPVRAIPGPAAPIVAWQTTGGFGLPFVFSGFPPKGSASSLKKFFSPILGSAKTFCFFLSRHDLLNVMSFLSKDKDFSGRKMFLARELTKPHEEIFEGKAQEILDIFNIKIEANEGVGEVSVLIEGDGKFDQPKSFNIDDWDPKELRKLKVGSPKEAAKILSKLTGWQVSDCYEILANKD